MPRTQFNFPSPLIAAPTVKVLIVDDSAVVRQILTRELSRDPGIQVVGTAPDPYVARDKIVELCPDVITLDVEMPRMDGITFLRKLMLHFPMPVIVLSSLTAQGTQKAIEALEAGAVEVLGKPSSAYSIDNLAPVLIEKVKSAAAARVRATMPTPPRAVAPNNGSPSAVKILAIGASTGGVQALTELLSAFPADAPGTVIVQHMPAHFTRSFAERLNTICPIAVKEAADGDTVFPGRALIAPGGFHTVLRKSGTRYLVQIKDGPDVHHQKPSVDVLFDSVARCAGPDGIGVILTGMGVDGARGLLQMRTAGARTLAQDEKSSTIFGMPMEAIRCGGAERAVSLQNMAPTLMQLAREKK